MKVLLIDDDRSHLESFSEALNLNGIETNLFDNPIEAFDHYAVSSYDAVITDLRMKEMDGLRLLKKILQQNPVARVIVITGYPFDGDKATAIKKGAYAFVHKPLNIKGVIDALDGIADDGKNDLQ